MGNCISRPTSSQTLRKHDQNLPTNKRAEATKILHINENTLFVTAKDNVTFSTMAKELFEMEKSNKFLKGSRFTIVCGVHHEMDQNSQKAKITKNENVPGEKFVREADQIYEMFENYCKNNYNTPEEFEAKDYKLVDKVDIYEDRNLNLRSHSVKKLKTKFETMVYYPRAEKKYWKIS